MKVIGLISGTSIDGIDAVLVEITGENLDIEIELLNAETYPYPTELKSKIIEVCHNQAISMAELAQLDDAIAYQFAISAQNIQQKFPTATIIGSHGQTVYHRPPILRNEERGTRNKEEKIFTVKENTNQQTKNQKAEEIRDRDSKRNKENSSLILGYSMQLGRGEVIANLTRIPTVSNFRAADIAAGGHGAPLVSKIDICLLSHPTKHRVIQNLGGIGNFTYLPPRNNPDWEQKICGWDTGPANVLIDLAISELTDGKQTYDRNGEFASGGTPCKKLVQQWLEQDYFLQSPPKSTGRELFNQDYLNQCWQDAQTENLSDADWLATITELTVASIAHSYRTFLPQIPDEILLCGGGSRNIYLRQRLQAELTSAKILTTDEVGLDGDHKEAIAFAILAYWRYHCNFPGNVPQVTSANKPMLLGDIHLPQL
ncbi:Anhydro-N-acetylmuramic acid kinase [Hyella patelloides LEGE 07179]|uniref:Anhydro-N-acetylmuramic acid kinase n=1 Tax=Hyella patelloides LEGE 07179 TaxID=945734 RepID=A0A563W321_9CYAN|nr:anhydro-N-acetylmuramic acid kinase [Hyella patelloides]VEP18050.1 Anhydro-N-acetylmuramic acid kinase [Hyella patelloides LEGE 07179]